MPEVGVGAAAGLLAGLVPAKAVAAETRVDESESELFPPEEALIARAVPKRRREFTAGRVCARRAMARLGIAPTPLLAGPNREPLWPAGVVGSITHCEGYRAAAAARAEHVLSLGIDAEPNGPTPDGVFERISLPAESSWVRAAARAEPEVHWDRLLFCAKESVYKTWFPLAGGWLGFEEALVTLDDGPATGRPADGGPPGDRPTGDAARPGGTARRTGSFTAKLLVAGPVLPDGQRLTLLRGRYLVTAGLILAVVAISPDDRVDGDGV
ncbi:4'-phosphopantetheinyl transferase superfamily protein [Pseudofrankia sp. DC12]|uniref:4'-phosphopantetheinyl transferase family protein n=1 Tax=Pseudofrankia sp. DC12 TaxID=683315 RepID=UPI0005F803CF|nr:4'-phosphopantetheinyl transferase superfamily protein [Pseudofrankia sp. DC12]